jgi:hypothetical protein
MIIVFVSIVLFSGGIAVGVKVYKFARNRRKSDALDYIRSTGLYPPIYSGYAEQPQPQPQQPQQPTNNVPIFDQFLFIGIVCAVAYVFWCGLT